MTSKYQALLGRWVRVTRKRGLETNKHTQVFEGVLHFADNRRICLSEMRYRKGRVLWLSFSRGDNIQVIEKLEREEKHGNHSNLV